MPFHTGGRSFGRGGGRRITPGQGPSFPGLPKIPGGGLGAGIRPFTPRPASRVRTPRPGQQRQQITQQAISSAQGARESQEASKKAALGFFDPISEKLGALSQDIISPEQQQRLETQRKAELGAFGQNLASQFGDASSGVQAGARRQIALGIAGRQANLPIQTELEVGQANRASALGLLHKQV
jgi:hypothetical protein